MQIIWKKVGILVFENRFRAAKLLYQTAKTCQYLEKSLFFLCFLQSFPCLVISLVVFLSLYRSQKVIRPAEAYIWLFVAQSL